VLEEVIVVYYLLGELLIFVEAGEVFDGADEVLEVGIFVLYYFGDGGAGVAGVADDFGDDSGLWVFLVFGELGILVFDDFAEEGFRVSCVQDGEAGG